MSSNNSKGRRSRVGGGVERGLVVVQGPPSEIFRNHVTYSKSYVERAAKQLNVPFAVCLSETIKALLRVEEEGAGRGGEGRDARSMVEVLEDEALTKEQFTTAFPNWLDLYEKAEMEGLRKPWKDFLTGCWERRR